MEENEVKVNQEDNISTKNRFTALMLCWFLGFLGIHRLYIGKLGSGFLMAYGTIVTCLILMASVPIGLMCLITMAAFVVNDFFALAFGHLKDCYGKQICSDKLN